MQEITLEEICNLLLVNHHNITNSIRICGVSTDSRTIKPGELFIALRGETFDGHDFIRQALSKGAAAVLVDHIPDTTCPYIIVRNTLRALQDIGRWHRMRMPARVIGITGSHGKTTCKELIAGVLGQAFKVHVTPGNLNGQIGLPLVLLGLHHEDEMMILEMGVSKPGEMDALVHIAQPDVGVLLNIAPVHTEFFGDLDGIIREKIKLLSNLRSDQMKIINRDDSKISENQNTLNGAIVTFGIKNSADIQATEVAPSLSGTAFTVKGMSINHRFFIHLPGVHHVYNALPAIAIGLLHGMGVEDIDQGLRSVHPVKMRTEIHECNGIIVINDEYNAAPQSMKAAIALLKDIAVTGKRIAVLGDMLELGERAIQDHFKLGQDIAKSSVDHLLCIGNLSVHTIKGAVETGMAPGNTFHAQSHEELAHILEQIMQSGDIILIKGSRGMHLEKIYDACFRC